MRDLQDLIAVTESGVRKYFVGAVGGSAGGRDDYIMAKSHIFDWALGMMDGGCKAYPAKQFWS